MRIFLGYYIFGLRGKDPIASWFKENVFLGGEPNGGLLRRYLNEK